MCVCVCFRLPFPSLFIKGFPQSVLIAAAAAVGTDVCWLKRARCQNAHITAYSLPADQQKTPQEGRKKTQGNTGSLKGHSVGQTIPRPRKLSCHSSLFFPPLRLASFFLLFSLLSWHGSLNNVNHKFAVSFWKYVFKSQSVLWWISRLEMTTTHISLLSTINLS